MNSRIQVFEEKTVKYCISDIIWKYLLISIFMLLSSCSETIEPRVKPCTKPDTSSHAWVFTKYELGMQNSKLHDVQALNGSFAVAVGHLVENYSPRALNSYVWDNGILRDNSLPIRAAIGIGEDTSTVRMPDVAIGKVDAIRMIRRDNIWCGTSYGAYSHITVSGSDTMVLNENYTKREDVFVRKIWASDTDDVWLGCYGGILWRRSENNWRRERLAAIGSNHDMDYLWGEHSANVYAIFSDPGGSITVQRYNGSAWSQIYKTGDSSLSSSVDFGAPRAIWGAAEDDSLWISGLYLGRVDREMNGDVVVVRRNETGFKDIHGSATNSVFFVGYNGAIVHYNGATLHNYNEFAGEGIVFNSVHALNNEVFIVGEQPFGPAIFVHGRRD